MIFHENHLLNLIFEKQQNLKLSPAANYRWRLMGLKYATSNDRSQFLSSQNVQSISQNIKLRYFIKLF